MAIRDIERNMNDFLNRVNSQISEVNERVGESFVSNARQTNTYKDQTANLRNSIGYIIVTDKQKLKESFGGGEGGTEGKEAAGKLAQSISDDGLILVAGMSYAAAVESKGFDVISNSVNKAREQHQKLMKPALNSVI
jgi:hypothetical protein